MNQTAIYNHMDQGQSNQSPPYTIGVVLGDLLSDYEQQIYYGIRDAVKARGIRVIFYPIKPIGIEVETRATSPKINHFIINNLFDLNYLDGVIVIAEVIQIFYGNAEVTDFYKMFAQIPLINIGSDNIGSDRPRIDINNYDGMRRMFSHVIETCGYQHIAFVRGIINNRSADERFQAYQDALNHHGCTCDERWIVNGDFKFSSGVQAVQTLLDDRQLKPEVIVASNDEMALGALWALQQRGIRVPDDIGVTGFDDDALAQLYSPSLTTIQQPTYHMGHAAVDALMSQLAGHPPIDEIMVPARLIVRESCCLAPTKTELPLSQNNFESACRQIWQQTLTPLLTNFSSTIDEALIKNLTTSFLSDINDQSTSEFLSSFKTLVAEIPYSLPKYQLIQDALDQIKAIAKVQLKDPLAKARAYDLCYNARVIIDRSIMGQHIIWQRSAITIVEGENELLYTPTLETLNKVLNRMLSRLGIRYCYVSLFDSYPATSTQPRLVTEISPQGNHAIENDSLICSISQWHNITLPVDAKSMKWMVSLLNYGEECIGLLTMSMEPRVGLIYETLRVQISSMLKLMLSIQQLQAHALDLEEQIQNRTHDLKTLLVEKHDLMAIVAHDLRNPLTGLQLGTGLLNERWQTMKPERIYRILSNVENNTQQMLSIIERLLQNNQTEQENFTINLQPVALCRLIQQVSDSFDTIVANKKIQLVLNLCPQEIFIHADPELLKQVLDNLVSNAIKYSYSKTNVTISVASADDKYQINITDEGQGLTEADIPLLFGRYQRLSASPTAGESSVGLGLYIVKKMVTAMKGDVFATSPGKDLGSTFTVVLPGLTA